MDPSATAKKFVNRVERLKEAQEVLDPDEILEQYEQLEHSGQSPEQDIGQRIEIDAERIQLSYWETIGILAVREGDADAEQRAELMWEYTQEKYLDFTKKWGGWFDDIGASVMQGVSTVMGWFGMGKLKEELESIADTRIDEGIESVSESVEQMGLVTWFETQRKNAVEYVGQWGGLAAQTGVGTASLASLKKALEGLEYDNLEAKTKEKVEALWQRAKDAPEGTAEEMRKILFEELQNVPGTDFLLLNEWTASRIKDAKKKASFIQTKGLRRLRRHLQTKNVSVPQLTQFDALVTRLQSSDYTKTSTENWTALEQCIESIGGMEMVCHGGYMVLQDYTDGNLKNFIIGFEPSMPEEEILNMPTFYLGSFTVLRMFEESKEFNTTIVDSIKGSLGPRATNTLEYLKKLQEQPEDGRATWFLPETYTGLLEALDKDAQNGSVTFAIASTGAIAVWNGGWHLLQSSYAAVGGGLWEFARNSYHHGWKAGLKAGAMKFEEENAPFLFIFGGAAAVGAIHDLNPKELMLSVARASVMSGIVVYKSGKMAYTGARKTAQGIETAYQVSRDMKRFPDYVDFKRRHFLDTMGTHKLMPRFARLKLLGGGWNDSRMLEIGRRAREVAYLESLQSTFRTERGIFDMRQDITNIRLDMEKTVDEYLRKNFKYKRTGLLFKRSDPDLCRQVARSVVDQYRRTIARGQRVPTDIPELQHMVDTAILSHGIDIERIEGRQEKLGRMSDQRSELDELLQAENPDMVKAEVLEAGIRKIEAEVIEEHVQRLREGLDEVKMGNMSLDQYRRMVEEGAAADRVLMDLFNERADRIMKLGKDSDLARSLAAEYDDLAESIRVVRQQQLRALLENYNPLMQGGGLSKTERLELESLYKRLTGDAGGTTATKLLRSATGRLKYAALLMIPTLYMKHKEIKKQNPEARLLEIFKELGLEGVQLTVDILAPYGVSDWYTVFTGYQLVTGRELKGWDRYSNILWGTFSMASDILATIATPPTAGAGGAGVYGGANLLEAAGRLTSNASLLEKLRDALPNLVDIVREIGVDRFVEIAQSIKDADSFKEKAIGGLRMTEHGAKVAAFSGEVPGIVQTIGGISYHLVYSNIIGDNGVKPPAVAYGENNTMGTTLEAA